MVALCLLWQRFVVCVFGFGFCLHSAFFWFGCCSVWPLACAASVSRHLLVGLSVAWGCAGVAVGGVCTPAPFFSGCGGCVWFLSLLCRGFVVSAAACPGLRSVGLRPPFSFRLGCGHVFFSASHFSSAVCVGVSGMSFPPLGRCSRLGVAGFGRAVLRCSFAGLRGCRLRCCLAGGFPPLLLSGCLASRLCVCLLPPPAFFRLWFLFVSFFFLGGGLPVPPSAFPGLVHHL